MRFEGTIKTWNDDRGFGFIEPTQGGQEVFIHIKAFQPRCGRPHVGQPVFFEVELDPRGKKRAKNVASARVVRPNTVRLRASSAQWGTATLFAIPAFLILYLIVFLLWRPPTLLAAGYLAASVITFLAYAIDKSAAEHGAWRTSESTLHLLALAGGWPGALLAQQFLRHKSTKTEFRSAFWGTAAVNVIAFLGYCSPLGRHFWAAQ